MIKRLALTPGEPAGIGPELLIRYVQHASNHEIVAFADPKLLERYANHLGLSLRLREMGEKPNPSKPNELSIMPVSLRCKERLGTVDPDNSEYVLNCLDAAINACVSKECDAIVTGPIQKSSINAAGIDFTGHTEYLAKRTNTPCVVMMLATAKLRVALATTHIPLRKVPDTITFSHLANVIRILHNDLRHRFGIPYPRILVCGLNPHAGESGHLGREEEEIIIPAVTLMRASEINVTGPLPADTIFTEKYLNSADAVLAMYHDQGLPVLKSHGFGCSANITLGLPIVRTSVDHGTALDLAGKGIASIGSLQIAIQMALQISNSSSEKM